MFKFVVLCAFLAAATAEPGALLGSYPLAYSTAPVAAPLTTAYVSSANVYQPAAVAYSTPYGFSHFIKKRSANYAYGSFIAPTTLATTYSAAFPGSYSTPYVTGASLIPTAPVAYTAAHLIKKRSVGAYVTPTTYVSSAPLATTYSAVFPGTYSTPYITGSSVVSAGPVAYSAAHLIKKRSVAAYVAPTTYVTPTTYAATSPFVSSAYAGAPVYSTPYIATAPVYSSHFIKKRSAPLALSTYVAPSAYSTQTRVDYSAPLAHSYVSTAPVSYLSPYGAPLTHVF